jgi:YidC/Oxa1 family membrane protein insertase
VTMISADPMQRRIMLALPFVFVVFIINFEAGLIVYWITTNVWTIGQQLLVRKLYPKPPPRDFEAEAAAEARKPARGKPVEEEVVGDGAREKPKAAVGGGNGGPRKAPPPRSPRKKKKRSGRRR